LRTAAFGDESWASEMDALFDGASDAFLAPERLLNTELSIFSMPGDSSSSFGFSGFG
jgi:hypothetical protein